MPGIAKLLGDRTAHRWKLEDLVLFPGEEARVTCSSSGSLAVLAVHLRCTSELQDVGTVGVP